MKADDPFAHRADGTPWADVEPPQVSQSEADKAADLRLRRDRSNAKQKDTKRKQTDLESKTRELYRSLGFTYARTEHRTFTGNRSDMFGFVDGIAVGGGPVLFVQTTSRANLAAHVKKMATGVYGLGGGAVAPCYPVAVRLIENPHTELVIVLWDQPGGKGTEWQYETVTVTLAMLQTYREKDP